MSEHDELDARTDALFKELREHTEDLLDAPSPAHIRRLGDRRRARRRTAVAASTMAVAAVLGTSVMRIDLLRGGPEAQTAASPSPRPATTSFPSPTPSPSATTTPSSSPGPTATATATASHTTTPRATSVTPSGDADAVSPTPSVSTTSQSSGAATPSGYSSGTPTSSQSPSPRRSPLTWDNVADQSVLYNATPGDIASSYRDEGSGVEGHALSMCTGSLDSLGARQMMGHMFQGVYVIALDFSTTDQATAARGVIRDWFSNCASHVTSRGYTDVVASEPAEQSGAVSATPSQISYRTLQYSDREGMTTLERNLLLQAGTRVQWVQYYESADNGSAATTAIPAIPESLHAQQMLARLAGE